MGKSEREEQESGAAAETTARLEFKVRERTIEEIAKLGFDREGKAKMGADSVKLAKEAILVFVTEGLRRSCLQAKLEGKSEVKEEHLEKILPQFLLDFS